MPALAPVPAVLRLHIKSTDDADTDILPGSFWKYSGAAPTSDDLVTMATAVYGALATPLAGMMPSASHFTGIFLVDLSSDTAAVGSYESSTIGDRSGDPLPSSTAADIAFVIARRYRGGKPRTEMPWGTISDLETSQTWSSSFITAANAAWGDVVTAMADNVWAAGGTVTQVNVSYYGPPNRTHTSGSGRVTTVSTPRSSPLVDTILSYGCQTRFGSVRRRLGKSA